MARSWVNRVGRERLHIPPPFPEADLTIARMPARTASGSLGQAAETALAWRESGFPRVGVEDDRPHRGLPDHSQSPACVSPHGLGEDLVNRYSARLNEAAKKAIGGRKMPLSTSPFPERDHHKGACHANDA
jgi:hypothetical protein